MRCTPRTATTSGATCAGARPPSPRTSRPRCSSWPGGGGTSCRASRCRGCTAWRARCSPTTAAAGNAAIALAERAAAHAAVAAPDLAEAAGLRHDLAQALAGLSERDRELVLLVAWEGLTLAEAAAALGCRRGAAAVRLHRARRRLHIAMDGESPALAAMTTVEER